MPTTPLIITSAPNGAYKQLSDHPALPLTPSSLAQTARQCLDAGAAMLHLHIRDAAGHHSLDVQGYRDALSAVKAAVGDQMVLQVTSEAARTYHAPAQIAMVRTLRPEAVSVGLRELDQPEIGEAGLADFFAWLARERVMTQVILYDVADLQRWQSLRARGVVPDAPWFLLFVLGRYTAGQTSSPLDLVPFVHAHSGPEPWAVCAFGATEHACVTAAAALGGHVRVGFENNLQLKDGSRAPHNGALVAQAAEAAASLGRPLATARHIRERFGG
ncbi:3-keto-5-aminohexanoate cleavage protein [Curvibacter sp. HBC61]|uniref:3-keto-5-aminohexanoate cleavage protein n=1 Tax=Curvibacter cyanobacteriorum TaxID=3026422 RepID=A0ABT5N0K3_9BURK|nr:3-keto-5-aminohexanoate cleavage protein [Curvibacter sp. HBC61]MDD0839046.1 3-keto-5-aminohexanoate cleavage protein [Curvibacter sp. HBC61]